MQKQNQKTSTVEKKEVEGSWESGENDLFYAIQVASSKTQIKISVSEIER
ncbi:MAG: hypothetical protein ACLTZT_15135 [Butyricimonas faecalis]